MAQELIPVPTNSIVRIVTSTAHGSGVIVSDADVLTAGHVVDSVQDVGVTGPAWSGARSPVGASRPSDPSVDLAILHLSPERATARSQISMPIATHAVQVGDRVRVAGYSTRDRDLEVKTYEIASFDGVARALVLDRPVAPGMSGSPAFAESGLAGLVFARHFDHQATYLVPLIHIVEHVRASARGTVRWVDEAPSPLRRYPLGPAVPPSETLARSFELIRAYVIRFRGSRAYEAIARANAARRACGPESSHRGLIESAELPNPDLDPYGFWQQAFAEAGLKSPRMLAAVLSIVNDDDSLDAVSLGQRNDFLRDLEAWRQ